jgi:hypothetical protein
MLEPENREHIERFYQRMSESDDAGVLAVVEGLHVAADAVLAVLREHGEPVVKRAVDRLSRALEVDWPCSGGGDAYSIVEQERDALARLLKEASDA